MITLVPIFVSICRNIVAHWKIEAFALAIVTSIGLMANQLTAPKMLGAMIIVGEWSDAISKQMMFSTAVAAAFSMGTWWLQKNVLARRTLAAETKAKDAEKIAAYERAEKDNIAIGHVELMRRVTETERTLADFRERIVLMDHTVRPLYEATKLELIKTLTHPHPEFQIPDALLQEIVPAGAEMSPELAKMLKERETSTHPDVTSAEKLAAGLLPKIVQLANEEAKTINVLTTTQTVSTKADKPDDKE